ncbi:MAG: hydroxyacylglutathione hydrolase [Gammaproteobacteria bacterium]|nr:hydroxyacylglutathione hydrolase [Gammaproteobacteria bacterium]
MLIITPIPTLKDNYVWTIINQESREAIIVDPGEAGPVQDFLEAEKLSLVAILITHHHWDHTNGIKAFKSEGIEVYGPNNESIEGLTHRNQDDEVLSFKAFHLQFKCIAIPGHTLDHIAYYGDGMLFCGDTLFSAGCGRVFEGTAAMMFKALEQFKNLPDATAVYCAHEYTQANLRFAHTVEPSNHAIQRRILAVDALRAQNLPTLPSTIEIEKATNPFFRCDVSELIKNVEDYAGEKLNTPLEVFTWLRKWKDNF